MSQESSNIPLAQLAQQEVAQQVQQTNAHFYEVEQGEIRALDRGQLLDTIATMQAQMLAMQQQMQLYQQGLQAVTKHQQEVDQQAEEILATLQQPAEQVQSFPPPPVQTAMPVLAAPPISQLMLPAASASIPRVDCAKPSAPFYGKRSEDVESWLLAMQLYFAANQGLGDNQQAVRIALNLGGTAQRWLHNSIDIPLDQLTVQGISAELVQALKAPTKDQLARCQLSNMKQQGSVDGYAQAFRSTLYSCQDVSQAEARACFVERLKASTRLYVEERNPGTLDAAILLAQSYNTTQFGTNSGNFARGRGRFPS